MKHYSMRRNAWIDFVNEWIVAGVGLQELVRRKGHGSEAEFVVTVPKPVNRYLSRTIQALEAFGAPEDLVAHVRAKHSNPDKSNNKAA
jgi:hypothetical protein